MDSPWRRRWHRITSDEMSLGAAAIAFHSFLALMPLGLALLGGAALIGGDRLAVARITRALDPVAPEAVGEFLTDLLIDANRRIHGEWWVIAISVVVAVLLGSRAIVALQRALGTGIPEVAVRRGRSRRLVAVALTAAGGLAVLLCGILLVAGRSLFVFLAHWAGRPGLPALWTWLRLPIAIAALFGFLLLCYRYAPPQPVRRAGGAAALATVGVVVGSIGFGLFLGWAPRLGAVFGTLGAVAAALTWLYLGAWAILAGAALAGEDVVPRAGAVR
jgi:membrane protein